METFFEKKKWKSPLKNSFAIRFLKRDVDANHVALLRYKIFKTITIFRYTGGALITRVLIPVVLIPNQLEMQPLEQDLWLGIKTSSVGMGWILIFDSDHINHGI